MASGRATSQDPSSAAPDAPSSAASRSPHREPSKAPSPGGRAGATASAPSRARLEARDLGLRTERAARDHLVALGFTILGANLRVGRIEIDLLAAERSVAVVVEVRARGPGSLLRPLDTIDPRKRARLRSAARALWRDRFAGDLRFDRLRFDCVAVTIDGEGNARIEHVRAAF